MFAVPGWSISSAKPKAQSLSQAPPPPSGTEDGAAPVPKSNKRGKRKRASDKLPQVDANNLAELWETVIEGKEAPAEKRLKTEAKGQGKPAGDAAASATSKNEGDAGKPTDDGGNAKKDKKSKKDKKDGKGKKQKTESKPEAQDEADEEVESKPASATPAASTSHPTPKTTAAPPSQSTAPASLMPSTTKLTPLQASMRQKLISARFRHLNQTLYTAPSAESFTLFQENPEMFSEYHEGFARQVESWPENPVDTYINQILTRGKVREPRRDKAQHQKTPNANTDEPLDINSTALPRTRGTCWIADLGCGSASLSAGLQKSARKLHLEILSYDLQAPNKLVTKADIANLPLEDGSIDVAIFCLALMGTNWIDFIEEAYRILHWKGELWIAEIKSRFGKVSGKAGNKRVEHSVGNRQKKIAAAKAKNAKPSKADEEAEAADLAVEVDGQEDTSAGTDVSAFVEVLRKRGFVLQNGEGAVDLRNRMFVKMCFVKAAKPSRGKGAVKEDASGGGESWKHKKPKAKFLEEEKDDMPVEKEAKVLLPCVYKVR